MTRILIGLVGKKQAGKDTFAAQLCLHHSFTRVAFADPLKEMALALNPLVATHGGSIERLAPHVTRVGWDRAKQSDDIRRLLQNLGTAVREQEPFFWIDRAVEALEEADDAVVITDVRYPNEADLITANGGILIRINRPGLDSDDDHTSETELDSIDVNISITNNQGIKDLEAMADVVYCLLPALFDAPDTLFDWPTRWRVS